MAGFSRRALYNVLKESADYEWLLAKFPPDYHVQLRHFLLDGLCSGVFNIIYGDCRTGFWCHNNSCVSERLEEFLADHDKAPMFPEEVYEKTFANPNKTKTPIRKACPSSKALSGHDRGQLKRAIRNIDKNKKRLAPARQKRILRKEANSINKYTATPRSIIIDGSHGQYISNPTLRRKLPRNSKSLDKNKQARSWNDDIARDFQKELDRLRKARFDNNLDGIDRGALK